MGQRPKVLKPLVSSKKHRKGYGGTLARGSPSRLSLDAGRAMIAVALMSESPASERRFVANDFAL